MKVTQFTRRALTSRRESKRLTALGYRRHETDWEIHRGFLWHDRIKDAKVSACGKYVWTLLDGETKRRREADESVYRERCEAVSYEVSG